MYRKSRKTRNLDGEANIMQEKISAWQAIAIAKKSFGSASKNQEENSDFDVAAEIKKHARVFKNGNISLQNQRVKVLYRNTSRWHNAKPRWTSHIAVVQRGGEWIVEGKAANDALTCFLMLNKQLEYLESCGLKRPSKILTCRIV